MLADSSIAQYTGGEVKLEKTFDLSMSVVPMPELAHVSIGMESVNFKVSSKMRVFVSSVAYFILLSREIDQSAVNISLRSLPLNDGEIRPSVFPTSQQVNAPYFSFNSESRPGKLRISIFKSLD